MSAKITHNICVAVGKYNKVVNGENVEKTNWLTVGKSWLKDDGGTFHTMEKTFNPAGVPTEEGKNSFFLNFFEIKDDDQPKKQEQL